MPALRITNGLGSQGSSICTTASSAGPTVLARTIAFRCRTWAVGYLGMGGRHVFSVNAHNFSVGAATRVAEAVAALRRRPAHRRAVRGRRSARAAAVAPGPPPLPPPLLPLRPTRPFSSPPPPAMTATSRASSFTPSGSCVSARAASARWRSRRHRDAVCSSMNDLSGIHTCDTAKGGSDLTTWRRARQRQPALLVESIWCCR